MAVVTGPALVVAVIYQGAVWLVRRELVKKLITMGARELTKKNFKKSYQWFRGSKKANTSEKNKILENIGIKITKPKVLKTSKKPVKDSFSVREKKTLELIKNVKKDLKIKQAKKITKVPESSIPGIRPNESLHAYFTRMAKESIVKQSKKITKAPKKDIVKKPEAPKVESEAAKVAKLKETKVDRVRLEEKTKEVLSTSGKKVSDATVKQSFASKAYQKAKQAMWLAGWGGVTVAGGGLIFYMLDKDKVPKVPDVKLEIDLESDITTIKDKTITTADPEKTDIITPPIIHHVTKKNIAEKLQTLDFDQEGVTVITQEHPALPKKIPIPGYSSVITDIGD